MSVDPTISASREDARRLYREDTRAWKERYEAYLRTREWRQRRDDALRRAKWTCERCPAQRGLQVHHKTYERLGNERPEDLQVLCVTCHEGHHIDETQQVRGVYLAVIADLLKRERFTCVADLMEAAKRACARQKIPYNGSRIYRAIAIADARRHGILDAPKPLVRPATVEDIGRPPTKAEALDFFRMIGFNIQARNGMPSADEKDDYFRDMERANEIRRQAAEAMRR